MIFDIFLLIFLALFIVILFLLSLILFFNSHEIPKEFSIGMIILTIFAAIMCFGAFNEMRINWKIDSIKECYMGEDIFDEYGISEYEFLDRLNSETGREIIKDAIDNDEIGNEDGKVYIDNQELLDVLGLD